MLLSSRKSQSISGRRSSASLRAPSTLANDFGVNDDNAGPTSSSGGGTSAGGGRQTHSLAHELAAALMPEPSAGSKLLAEELGLEFDEGAEGIIDDDQEQQQPDALSPTPAHAHDYDGDYGQSHTMSEHDFLSSSSNSRPSFADELGGHDSYDGGSYTGDHHDDHGGLDGPGDDLSFMLQEHHGHHHHNHLDPTFDDAPSPPRAAPAARHQRQKTPEKDAMDILSENLEFTDKFLSHLRCLDTEGVSSAVPPGARTSSLNNTSSSSSSQQPVNQQQQNHHQPNLERLASDVIRRINDSVRDRETQVRVLLECEREFKKISGEVGGGDLLGQLDELEDLGTKDDNDGDGAAEHAPTASPPSQHREPRSLHTLIEEDQPGSPVQASSSSSRRRGHLSRGYSRDSTANDWELDRHAHDDDDDDDRSHHLGDYDPNDHHHHQSTSTHDPDHPNRPSPPTSPQSSHSSFPPPPPLTGPPTPSKLLPHLTHIRSFTTSTISSLSSISEHAQVNGVATADAARKIRSLKNKLGAWKTEWESAERSRERIERWEAGIVERDGATVAVAVGTGNAGEDEVEEEEGKKAVGVTPSMAPPLTPTSATRFASRRVDGRKIVQEQLKAFELVLADAALKTQAIMAR